MFHGKLNLLYSINVIRSLRTVFICVYCVSKLKKSQKQTHVYSCHRPKLSLKWVVCPVSSYCSYLQHGV